MTNQILSISKSLHHFSRQRTPTNDLKVRLNLLECEVTDLQDQVEELETANTLRDECFNTFEGNMAENSNDIDGKLRFRNITQPYVAHSLLIKKECISVGCIPSTAVAMSIPACTGQGGIPAFTGQGDVCHGCLPRQVSAQGVFAQGCISQHALRQTPPPPVNRMIDRQV